MPVTTGKLGKVRLSGEELTTLRTQCFVRDKFHCRECGRRVSPFSPEWAPNRAHMAHISEPSSGNSLGLLLRIPILSQSSNDFHMHPMRTQREPSSRSTARSLPRSKGIQMTASEMVRHFRARGPSRGPWRFRCPVHRSRGLTGAIYANASRRA
jgi:hypothetical protein